MDREDARVKRFNRIHSTLNGRDEGARDPVENRPEKRAALSAVEIRLVRVVIDRPKKKKKKETPSFTRTKPTDRRLPVLFFFFRKI